MDGFKLSRAASWTHGRRLGGDPRILSVGTDSRRTATGELFVALVGPRFDGHDFAAQVQEQGAAALLVARPLDVQLPQLVVADTRRALGDLAAGWRDTLTARVVALTGSNGKTTTREMIAAILAQAGPVASTRGNLNNDIGLPLTLLAVRDQAFAVLEMGANHPGEIARLSRIARPGVALVTNAGRAHLEGFGTLEGVARAKGEIVAGLHRGGTLVINADDPWADLWRRLAAGHRVIGFGIHAPADVSADPSGGHTTLNGGGFHSRWRVRTPSGSFPVALPLPGRHNLMNALAAVAVAQALGIGVEAVRRGLSGLTPVPGRLQPRTARIGARVIDDSYNANPESVRAAIEVLSALGGRRWLVMGDLAELGVGAEALHQQLGAQARAAGLDGLYTVGALSRAAAEAFGRGARHFEDQGHLIETLDQELRADDLVLVKGSRGARMDRVVDALCGAEV